VKGIDFSERMIATAVERAERADVAVGQLSFEVENLTSVNGAYDTVACIDVFARYSTEEVAAILRRLGSMATLRLIFTFTPKTMMDRIWHWIGSVYARHKRALPLHTHSRADIVRVLESAGWTIRREEKFSAGFRSYFCCLVEARRISPEDAFVLESWL